MSSVFWWLNLVRLYSLHKIRYPKGGYNLTLYLVPEYPQIKYYSYWAVPGCSTSGRQPSEVWSLMWGALNILGRTVPRALIGKGTYHLSFEHGFQKMKYPGKLGASV